MIKFKRTYEPTWQQKAELVDWFSMNMGKYPSSKFGKDERKIVYRCHEPKCECWYCKD